MTILVLGLVCALLYVVFVMSILAAGADDDNLSERYAKERGIKIDG
jgi:hypothetical protein